MPHAPPVTLTRTVHQWRRRVSRGLLDRLLPRPAAAGDEPLPITGIHRILVVKASHTLGNTLLVTPLLRELEVAYPGAEVDVVTRSPVGRAVFAGFPCVGTVHVMPRHGFREPLRLLRQIRAMRRARYDLAIDADPRSQTGRALVNLVCPRHSLGFVGPAKAARVSHGVDVPESPRGVGALPVYLLRRARRDADCSRYPGPQLRLAPDECQAGRQRLAALLSHSPQASVQVAGGTVPPVIGVFANATGAKCLPLAWWTRFLHVLEPTCADHAIIELLPATGRSMLQDRYPTFFSSDIRVLAAVQRALALHVSADCGVMHLADAAGAPTVGLFDGTDPGQWAPSGAGGGHIAIAGRSPEAVAADVAAYLRGGDLPPVPPCPGAAETRASRRPPGGRC